MRTFTKFALGAAAAVPFAFAALPAAAHAATYHYLDLQGTVHDVRAPSSAAALVFVAASADTLHSGVKLDTGFLVTGQNYGFDYQYRATGGGVSTVTAASIDAARLLAADKAATSGFVIVP